MSHEDKVINFVLKSCPKNVSTSSKPKTKLTTEDLAKELDVSKDFLLSKVKKCHEHFNKWSATYGKGKWDFEIDTSEENKSILKFEKVD